MSRRRKQLNTYAYSDDESFDPDDSDSSSDSEFVYVSETKKKKVEKSNKKQTSIVKQSIKASTRKRNMSGAMALKLAPKVFEDIPSDDLTRDPAGNQRRFIPYKEIEGKVLLTETYLAPKEDGVLTFLENFEAGNPNHLEYFGLTSKLQKTELIKIKEMTNEELKQELERSTNELNMIPPTKNVTTISIPGFSTNLKNSIAINADVRYFDWKALGNVQKFDVILMDPPWQIAVANVTRGVNIAYEQLATHDIAKMPLQYIQDNGFMFMWVIASQLMNGIAMLKNWGYKVIHTVNWIKVSRTGRYMPSHGYYFQHNKETLLVGIKGSPPEEMNPEAFRSLIVAQREVRQSQKPEELYEMIEEMFPGMMYLEVFARPHNLREGWVSMGIELPT